MTLGVRRGLRPLAKTWAASVALAMLAACTTDDTRRSVATTTTAHRPLQAKEIVAYEAPDAEVLHVTLWDHYLAWAGGTELIPEHISVHDLDTGETRVVARRENAEGHADWPRGSRNTLVYVDLARVGSTREPGVPWKLFKVDVISGERTLLAQSRSTVEEQVPPLPEIEWPWVVWGAPLPDGMGAVFAHDLRSDQTRIVTSFPLAELTGAGITGGKVVVGRLRPEGDFNVASFEPDGDGRPTPLTSTGDIAAPQAANGLVAWHQRKAPEPSKGIWVRPVADGEPRRLADRGTGPVPGTGFVAWYDPDQHSLVARDSEARGPLVTLAAEGGLSIQARWQVSGDRVVFATLVNRGTPDQRATIRVVQLSQ